MAPLFALMLAMLTALRPPTAEAQTAVQPAVVLDFATQGTIDPIVGRKAADALAVELQRSGDYEIITRQQVEDAVRTQPGLRPPFNEPTQQRLASVVGARSVFSGRVLRVDANNRRSARVLIEVRQLDTPTGDYINGTQVSEVTSEKLEDVDNDVLVDEAINKASYAAVRAMKQTRLPEGTVLNVTRNDIEISLGARNGVVTGQRYSVLRDVFNRAINRVERVKVAEVSITRAEADQATAVLSAGGQAGVRTSDKVRQIYVPSPLAALRATGSSPVTSPPITRTGTDSGVKKTGNLLLGAAALVGLVALAGFGGGDSNTPTTPPKSVVARPIAAAPAVVPVTPIEVNFRDGLPGVVRPSDLLAGYLIFRSTSPSFAAGPETLIDYVRGNQTRYTDTSVPRQQRTLTVTASNVGQGSLIINETLNPTPSDNSINQTAGSVTVVVEPTPVQPGVQYFYRVTRILAQRTTTTTGGNTPTTTVTLTPVLSNASAPSGGATATPTQAASNIQTNGNLNDFIVTLLPTQNAIGTTTVPFAPGEIDQIIVQISKSPSFPSDATYQRIEPNRPPNAEGNIVLDLDAIIVPNFEPGDVLYIRIGLRNTTDEPGALIFSRPQIISTVVGGTAASVAPNSRFLGGSVNGRRRGGVGLPGAPGSGAAGSITRGGTTRSTGRRGAGHILRPR